MISMSDAPSHRVQNIPVIQPDAIAATILRCSLKQKPNRSIRPRRPLAQAIGLEIRIRFSENHLKGNMPRVSVDCIRLEVFGNFASS